MSELLRVALVTDDDTLSLRQLTREMARKAGVASPKQARLATATSALARRALGWAVFGVARIVLEADAGSLKLVVIISLDEGVASGAGERSPTGAAVSWIEAYDDLKGIRELVDEFEVVTDESGSVSARLVTDLALTLEEPLADLAGRLTSTTVRNTAVALQRRNAALAHALALLRYQSKELAIANEDLRLAHDRLATINAELDATNTGALSLNSELEQQAGDLARAYERLQANVEELEQLGDQQTALAELGRLAIASTDAAALTVDVVSRVRRALGLSACAILRLQPESLHFDVVAADGCDLASTQTIDIGLDETLVRGLVETRILDLPAEAGEFPLPLPSDARSAALVGLQTPTGLWGVLAAYDSTPERFTDAGTAFLEAASALLAFQVSRAASEDAAKYAVGHDALTGLSNRAAFMERLGMATDDESGRLVGVVFIDLDDFKEVNDVFGHHVGDELLIEVSERLRSVVRPDDFVARVGGDEFAVLVDGVTDTDAVERAVARIHEALSSPADLGVAVVNVLASSGWATSDGERNPSALLRKADLAMYHAKERGKNMVAAFEPAMLEAVRQEAMQADRLRDVLARNELVVYFQPVIDLCSGQISGAEALLRWADPNRGLLAASEFLSTARHIGLMPDITTWVLTEACRFARAHMPVSEGAPFVVAVNVTKEDIEGGRLRSSVDAALAASGLPASHLCLEITESGILADVQRAVTELAKIRARGVAVAIDDFGTGYSSVGTLKRLDVDLVKIHGEFIDGLGTELDDSAVVAAIIAMAHRLGLGVVAEGVETARQLDMLCELGCEFAQGFLLGRPAPLTAALPARHVRQQMGERASTGPLAVGNLMTVVVADDLDDDRRLLRRSLTRSGRFIVLDEAEDGLRAVERTLELHPDLLLLDLQMPVLDGLAALARVRVEAPTTSVVVLTGHSSAETERAVVEAGALACIIKGSGDVVPELLGLLDGAGR